MDFLTAISLLAFAWAATLSGVIVGGWLVFKASGNAGSLFARTQGGAYNIEDGADDRDIDTEVQVPEHLSKHMHRFQNSFDPGDTLFGGGSGRHGAARPFEAPVPPKQGQEYDQKATRQS